MPVVDLPGNIAWTFVLKALTCAFNVHNMAADDMFSVVITPIIARYKNNFNKKARARN